MLLHLCLLSLLRAALSTRRNSTHVGILEAHAGWNIINSSGGNAHHSVATQSGVRRTLASESLSRVDQGSDFEHDSSYNEQQQSTTTTDKAPSKSTIVILLFASLAMLALGPLIVCGSLLSTPAPETPEQKSLQRLTEDVPMVLTILRSSGETIATVDAKGSWYGDMLRKAVSGSLPPHEYLHSIVYWVDTCEHQIKDFRRLGESGLQDGSKLRAITLSSYTLPSGLSLYSFKQSLGSPMGAYKLANLWIHTESSAWLEYGEILDVGYSSLKYPQGEVWEKTCVRLQEYGQEITGDIEESHIRFTLPVLGDVQLKQALPDAVFDVSQLSGFVGWISLFEGGEMVAKLGKIQAKNENSPDEAANLRFKVCRLPSADGSYKLTFVDEQDFGNWHVALAGRPRCSRDPATVSGPIGRRKLTLQSFPILGSVTLTEFPFCTDMSVTSPELHLW